MELLLVKKAQKGDQDAFVKLIEKNKMSLYKTAKSYLKNEDDVADAIQDTILSAYEHIGELRNVSYFKTWITRILMNHCNDLLRRQKRLSSAEWTEDKAVFVSADDSAFYELLEELPEDVRMIFLLYYGEGFTTKEVAQILELNENTVKSKLKRGRKKLKQAICY